MKEMHRYFIFGTHADGSVDIATTDNTTVATVANALQAEALIQQREELIQLIEEYQQRGEEKNA